MYVECSRELSLSRVIVTHSMSRLYIGADRYPATFIDQVFGGVMTSTVTCHCCQKVQALLLAMLLSIAGDSC